MYKPVNDHGIAQSNNGLNKLGIVTKRFLAGSEINEKDDFDSAPADRRLAVETVSNPATEVVAQKVAVTNAEITQEIIGTESADTS